MTEASSYWRKELRKISEHDLLCSWIDRINIVKVAVPPKSIYRFNAIPIKISIKFFTDLKLFYRPQKLKYSISYRKTNKNPGKQPWTIKEFPWIWPFPDYKSYDRTVVIKKLHDICIKIDRLINGIEFKIQTPIYTPMNVVK